jgi:hypothetical protein
VIGRVRVENMCSRVQILVEGAVPLNQPRTLHKYNTLVLIDMFLEAGHNTNKQIQEIRLEKEIGHVLNARIAISHIEMNALNARR